MADTVNSPNMNLSVPVVGVDPGPNWANDVNSCFQSIDSHDHASGNGVPITPDGMSINSDLPFNNSNAISLRSSRYTPQSSALGDVTDLGCVYVQAVDLYYNDVSGNVVRLTQSGGVAGSPGSIANLTSPASASYVAADETFVFQSNTNVAAIMDVRDIVLRNASSNSKGLTLSPPGAMGADIAMQLPAIPATTSLMTMDSGGNMGASTVVDNSSLAIVSGILGVKTEGINQLNVAIRFSGTSVSAGGFAKSNSSGNFSVTSVGSYSAVTGVSVQITTLGNPVVIWLQSDGSGSNSRIGIIAGGSTTSVSGQFAFFRGSTELCTETLELDSHGSDVAQDILVPTSTMRFVDEVAAGTYTYTIKVRSGNANSSMRVAFAKLCAWEDR